MKCSPSNKLAATIRHTREYFRYHLAGILPKSLKGSDSNLGAWRLSSKVPPAKGSCYKNQGFIQDFRLTGGETFAFVNASK